jgi:hypothetical protein
MCVSRLERQMWRNPETHCTEPHNETLRDAAAYVEGRGECI